MHLVQRKFVSPKEKILELVFAMCGALLLSLMLIRANNIHWLLSSFAGEEASSHSSGVAMILYRDLLLVMRTYWVLAVVSAFLLVILVGEPSVIKSVYLLFLFIFFLFYQVRPG